MNINRLPEFSSWKAMKDRCFRKTASNYHNYGGRGIKVCVRWQKSFFAFLEDMGKRPAGTTLDRKNTNGNYTPNNCRWATAQEQALGRRNRIVCSKGHVKAGKNLYLKLDGRACCRLCKRQYLRKWRKAA